MQNVNQNIKRKYNLLQLIIMQCSGFSISVLAIIIFFFFLFSFFFFVISFSDQLLHHINVWILVSRDIFSLYNSYFFFLFFGIINQQKWKSSKNNENIRACSKISIFLCIKSHIIESNSNQPKLKVQTLELCSWINKVYH